MSIFHLWNIMKQNNSLPNTPILSIAFPLPPTSKTIVIWGPNSLIQSISNNPLHSSYLNFLLSDPSILSWTPLVQSNMCSGPRTLSNSYNWSSILFPLQGTLKHPKQTNPELKTLPSFSHTSARRPILAHSNFNVKFNGSTVAFEASWLLVLFSLFYLIATTLQHEYCSITSVSLQICSNIYPHIKASAPHLSVKVELCPLLSYGHFPITLLPVFIF